MKNELSVLQWQSNSVSDGGLEILQPMSIHTTSGG